MRRFIYSTKRIDAADIDGALPDLYVVKIWHEMDPGHDVASPEAAEEIITVFANSPQQALEYAKNEWSGPIDRIEIVDVNPEDYDYDSTSIFNSTKVTAASSSREDSKRNKMYRPSTYPEVDPERIEDLLAINWNDVAARDCEYILKDYVNFPDLSVVASVRYPSDEEQAAIEAGMYDGGYEVTYTDGHSTFFAWHRGQEGMDEITIPETVEGTEIECSSTVDSEMSFRDWLNANYYDGFDPSGLSDEEYYELEDQYRAEVSRAQRERNYQ